MTAPAPRTAWSWQEHCRHCEWWVLLFYRKPVQVFTSRQAMADYVRAHPKGPGDVKPMNRHALTDIHRTAQQVAAGQTAAHKAAVKRAREARTPKPPAVLPNVLPGDTVITWTGARITVAKVNRVSVTSTGGVRYGADEIQYVMPGATG